MYMCKRRSTYVPSSQRKCINIKCPAFLDTVMCATTSKVIANTLSYPLETIRMKILCREKPPLDPLKLYTGFETYIPYCLLNNFITYKCFYTFMGLVFGNILISAFLTSAIVSCYKIPYIFTLKNRIIGEPIDFHNIYKKSQYSKALIATMSEDVPELFIKFSLSNVIILGQTQLLSSLIISLVASLILCPLEFWKTSILCSTKKLELTLESILMRVAITVFNFFIFFLCFDALTKIV
jgi:hypothetical protein